uniref:Uncharacterized protein n=1 Tax=Caenorhabditis japonica TaxID=281687 RepID=A0A8R1IBQ2_CAEJA
MNPVSDRYLKPIFEDILHIPIEHAVYSGAIFWPTDQNGVVYFNWYSGAGFINLLVTMGFAFTVVIVAGAKSWIKIRHLRKQGESKFTKNLQMQLYKALVAQTLIPVFLLFIPFSALFTGPLFFIDCEFLSAPLTFIYALYPALDPIPILFFVDNYRITISKFCCCCCFGCKKNQVIDSGESEYELQTCNRMASNNFV